MYSLFSNDSEENAYKTVQKLDCIWRNSNNDNDIYRMFNAFPLNLTSIQNPHRIPAHRPMGIPHSPHTHPISIPMGISMGVPIPTTALPSGHLPRCPFLGTPLPWGVKCELQLYWSRLVLFNASSVQSQSSTATVNPLIQETFRPAIYWLRRRGNESSDRLSHAVSKILLRQETLLLEADGAARWKLSVYKREECIQYGIERLTACA